MDIKVLLVNPGFKYIMMSHTIPLGLYSIGKILGDQGLEVEIIDINAEKQYDNQFLPNPLSPKEFLQKVKKIDPDIIGLTSYTANYPIAVKMAQMCKTENCNAKIVLGGMHATFQAEECLRENTFVDVVVRGEAEHVIADLVRNLARDGDLRGINNLVFRENNIIKYSDRNALPDLTQIPSLELEQIKNKHYPSFLLQVEFSRGCPFQCAFCCISPFSERKVRYFPIDRIIETLEVYEERFKNFSFSLSDATFLLNHKRVIRFLQEAKSRDIKLSNWLFETRVDTINREILQELLRYDAYSVALGIEDIHDSVLQAIGKQQTFQQIQKALKIIKELGYRVESNFIIGLPQQTRNDMLENISFTKNLDYFSFPCLMPFPGTRIYTNPKSFGITILSKEWDLYNGREIVTESDVFHNEQQRDAQDLAYREMAQSKLDDETCFYYEKERQKRILEIGYHAWQEEWKLKQQSLWN